MTDRKRPDDPDRPFPTPRGPESEADWEADLADWDAQLPVAPEDATPVARDNQPTAPTGATPEEENAYETTPITVTSADEEIEVDDDAVNEFADAPATDVAIVSIPDEARRSGGSGGSGGTAALHELFTADPPPEPPIASLADPLPEMGPEVWQAGLRTLVDVPDAAPPLRLDSAQWRALLRLYLDEVGVADTAAHQVELTLAAARVAEAEGDSATAVRLYEDALTLAPDAAAVLRGYGRLLESTGDLDGAQAAWSRLAVAAPTADERGFYAALAAEWTLARRGELDGAALAAIPGGPARLMAAAEVALLRGTPAETAAALEEAGLAAGGSLGVALLDGAARWSELGGDAAAAAEQRFVAARLDPEAAPIPLGRLRDAARLDPAAAEEALRDLAAVLPASALLGAVARWGAALARARGDAAAAHAFLDRADQALAATPSASVVRDRLDLWIESDDVPDGAALDELRARAGGLPRAALALAEATLRARGDDAAGALQCLANAISEAPDAVPLGLLAEEIGRAATDPALRAAAFDLLLRVDPARRAEAALALAEALEARDDPGGAPGEMAVRAALQTAIESAPGAAIFWTTAAHDARAGRTADAARTMAYGAEIWGASKLGPALAERAAELESSARAEGPAARPEAVLPADHPAALARVIADPETTPERVVDALWSAGSEPGARALRLAAVERAAVISGHDGGGGGARALALATELHESDPDWRPARDQLARLAARRDEAGARAALMARLPFEASDAADALPVAEALLARGELDGAGAVLSGLESAAAGRLAAEIGRMHARLEIARSGSAPAGAGLPAAAFAGTDLPAANAARDALAEIQKAARAGKFDEAAAALESAPPHEETASAATLYAVALLDEGRGAGERASVLCVAMTAAATVMPDAPCALACAIRAVDTDVGATTRAAAFELSAARVRAADPRSAAAFLCRAAGEREAEGDAAASEQRLRDALGAHPGHLPAAVGLRRAAARRGDPAAAAEACATEAALLVIPAHRTRALLLGAELARAGADPIAGRARAADLLRRALELDPSNDVAFERLRALLEQAGEHAALAEALSARIAVAKNPFQVTALRIARAELLAGPLADRAGAKSELEAILQKEPQHPRALARLADLEFEDGAYAAAGELDVRRTAVERAPDKLHEIFLRLGRIYTRHVPDPQRAVSAYARIVQLDPDHYEALVALSDLYFELGEHRDALPVTERLTAREPDRTRRIGYLVRMGQLWERSGDLRQAGVWFRRAADEAPRDAAAVGELARFLERTRDPAGRRALLDHAVGLLRHDVERARFDMATLRSLAPLLEARGRPRAAAAVAQLVAALAPPADGTARVTSRTRPARGLGRPEVDERSFPPELPPGVRHLFRIVGPHLEPRAPDLGRHGLGRNARAGRGQPPRDLADPIAAELGVREVDWYVKERSKDRAAPGTDAAPAPLVVEPGSPPAVILGAGIVAAGGSAVRFAATRALRLAATHLDLLVAGAPADAGALLGGLVRQFVPDYKHPELPKERLDGEADRVGRLLPKKLRPEALPFALESAGTMDVASLHAAVIDGANRAGLLVAGDLAAAVAVVLATAGRALSVEAIAASPEALALLRFALSDDYDEMAQLMEEEGG
jgi:Tfp pilus assembly protein PilF